MEVLGLGPRASGNFSYHLISFVFSFPCADAHPRQSNVNELQLPLTAYALLLVLLGFSPSLSLSAPITQILSLSISYPSQIHYEPSKENQQGLLGPSSQSLSAKKSCKVKLFLSEDSPSEVSKKHQYHLQANTFLAWLSSTTNDEDDDLLPPGFEHNRFQNRSKAESSHTFETKWEYPPSVALSSNWCVAVGDESKEKYAEKQREKHVLEAIYPRNSDIPASPYACVDVETESYDDSLTPLIPLEEEVALESGGQASSTLVTSEEAGIVSAFATIIAAILKGTEEEENKINADFLLQIAKDPITVAKIVEKYKAAMTTASSRTPETAPASGKVATTHDSVTRPPSPQPGVKRGASPETERSSFSRSDADSKSFVVKDINYYKSLITAHGSLRNRNHHRDFKRSRSDADQDKLKIQKPCKYFKTSRGCRTGSNCPYLHDSSVWRM
ncbi:hypothetical protein VNO78_08433 [Psophocarpus tetragonolobus]|uniref:C3H1-type domain-containing protein n=1 Tax=Psophocarpus tetragonolobus TaxID=3891 RepID=A0AAN9SW32_PSOTE